MANVSQLLESRRWRIARWAVAALIVCGLHAGGVALAIMLQQEEDDTDDMAGALAVEMVPMPAVMPVDSENAAVGPDQDAAKLTPEATKKVVEEVEKDNPQVEPSPAPEPEVVLPKPQPEEKREPTKEEAQDAPQETKQPPVTEAAEITTRQLRVEAQPSQKPASGQGMSASMARAQASWANATAAKLERLKRYPPAAERRGVKGAVVVRYWVDRSGQVLASAVSKSSGSPLLDDEALELVKRASPLPSPPDNIADEYLESLVTISFGMKSGR
jgi:protein TonB